MTAPRFDRDRVARGPAVQGISGDQYCVDGARFTSLLLTPSQAMEWQAPALADLSIDHLGFLLDIEPLPEFLLLGTGAGMAFAPRPLIAALESRGIGVEVMDSRAAARTWTLLRAEERWIAAALLPLHERP